MSKRVSEYDDEGSDLEYDYQAAVKEKKKKEDAKREKSRQKSVTPVKQKLDETSAVSMKNSIGPAKQLTSSASQKHLLDLIDQYKQRPQDKSQVADLVNVITVGNVDAGKSTIFGHLSYLQKRLSERDLKKVEALSVQMNKPTLKYAFLLDTSSTERERGLTISVNSYSIEIENKKYLMQDCPGHQDFSDSICTSVISPDAAVLVIEATDFDRIREQIEEKLNLVSIFNPVQLLIVVNKMDCCNYDSNVFKHVCQSVTQLLTEIPPFQQSKIKIQFIPCAGLQETDNNIIEFSERMPYAETTLKQALINCKPRAQETVNTDPKLIILDCCLQDGKCFMTVAIIDGVLYPNDILYLKPNNLVVNVIGIFDISGQELESAPYHATIRIQVSIYQKQVPKLFTSYLTEELVKIQTGSIGGLLSCFLQNTSVIQTTLRVRAKLYIVDSEGISTGDSFDGFIGMQRVECRVRKIDAVLKGDKFIIGDEYCKCKNYCVVDVLLEKEIAIDKTSVATRIILKKNVILSGIGLVVAWQPVQ